MIQLHIISRYETYYHNILSPIYITSVHAGVCICVLYMYCVFIVWIYVCVGLVCSVQFVYVPIIGITGLHKLSIRLNVKSDHANLTYIHLLNMIMYFTNSA